MTDADFCAVAAAWLPTAGLDAADYAVAMSQAQSAPPGCVSES